LAEGAAGSGQAILFSVVVAVVGIMLIVSALGLALANVVQALRPTNWATRWANETFVTFAWQEFGRGLFCGYLFALGMSPMTAFIFLDREGFWRNFAFGSAALWGGVAILVYFAIIIAGFFGFAIHRGVSRKLGTWGLYSQVIIVAALSAPLGYLLLTVLLPPVHNVLNLLVQTWHLYSRLPA
jgi:hypothetical protein